MHIPKVVFLRHRGNDAHQISEDLIRAIGEELNRVREGSNKIAPAYVYLQEDADLKGVPDVAMAIRCGISPVDTVINDIHHFWSLGSMYDEIVRVLTSRCPVSTPHPELPLTLEQIHAETDVVGEASRSGVKDEGLVEVLKAAQTAPGQIG